MAERESNDGQVQYPRLGGLNERPAPNALPSPDFDICQGLYPARDGLLQRLEGLDLRVTCANGIRHLDQLNDGTGQIIVQTVAGDEILYTLDEIFGRTAPTVDLTYLADTEEDEMSMALVVHTEIQGTDGGNINAGGATPTLDTFYRQKLTANSVNEDTIVTAFVASGGGADENTFTLAAGTYRVEGEMTFCHTYRYKPISLGTFTVTIASPAVFTNTGHNLQAGDKVTFTTTGALPTGIFAGGAGYFVLSAGLTANTFRVASTAGGAAKNTSGSQSGVHTLLPTAPLQTVCGAVYDETGSVTLATFTPAMSTAALGQATGNPNVSTTRHTQVSVLDRFTLAVSSKISIQAAVSDNMGYNWAQFTNCRGETHLTTTALGGASLSNTYTYLKIVKEP